MKKKGLFKDALILFAITLVAAAALSCVYSLTKEPIENAAEEAKQTAYKSVFDGANFEEIPNADTLLSTINDAMHSGEMTDNGVSLKKATVSEILCAVDENGAPLGYVLSVVSKSGYGGDVTAAVGVTSEGEVCGFTVLSHSETAGFGAKCDEPKEQEKYVAEYKAVFDGRKTVDQVDLISGATYTSNALKEIFGAARVTAQTAESGVNADA